jgi:hypothetical protein
MPTYTLWIDLPVTSDPERHAGIAHNLWDGLKAQHDDAVSHGVLAWDFRGGAAFLKVAMTAKAADESAAVAAALRVLRQAAGTDAGFLDLAGASASEVRLDEHD